VSKGIFLLLHLYIWQWQASLYNFTEGFIQPRFSQRP
jgi:hypothetical protein